MDALDWVVLVGVAVFPFLFAYAYREYRVGNRSERSFVRSAGVGGTGFSVLLQQAGDRWLSSPADDVLAVLSLVVLAGSLYAIYLGYYRDRDGDVASGTDQGE